MSARLTVQIVRAICPGASVLAEPSASPCNSAGPACDSAHSAVPDSDSRRRTDSHSPETEAGGLRRSAQEAVSARAIVDEVPADTTAIEDDRFRVLRRARLSALSDGLVDGGMMNFVVSLLET